MLVTHPRQCSVVELDIRLRINITQCATLMSLMLPEGFCQSVVVSFAIIESLLVIRCVDTGQLPPSLFYAHHGNKNEDKALLFFNSMSGLLLTVQL